MDYYRKETAHLPWRLRLSLETEAMRRAAQHQFTTWRGWATPVVLLLIIFVPWDAWLFGFPLIVAMWLWALRKGAKFERQVLREVMLRKNVRPAYCFECEYDLRGSSGSTCPECGSKLAGAPD